jgi:hypothetical protein
LIRDFTDKEWLFERIETWLGKPGGSFSRYRRAGHRQNAIIARLAQIHRQTALHFCIAGRVETVRPSTVLRSLAAQ